MCFICMYHSVARPIVQRQMVKLRFHKSYLHLQPRPYQFVERPLCALHERAISNKGVANVNKDSL